MQSDRKIADYISSVCERIKWKKAVPEIEDELQDHILCHKEALVAKGMDEAEAISLAVAQTGDAAFIGKKLNRANRPASKGNPFTTAALRQPLRTALLFLLIVLTSFAFITNAAEYIVTRNEISNIGSYYQTIGVLLQADPAQLDVTQGAKLLENSPYVAYTDWRRVASGIMPDMQNADFTGGSGYYTNHKGHDGGYASDAMFYGTVTEIVSFNFEPLYSQYINESYEWVNNTDIGTCYEIKVAVDNITVGRSEHIEEGQTVSIRVTPHNLYTYQLTEDISWVKDLQIGERYFLRAYMDTNSFYYGDLASGVGKPDIGSEQIRNASGSIKPNMYLTFRPVLDERTYILAPEQDQIDIQEEYYHLFDQVPNKQGIDPIIINYIPVQPGQPVDFDDPALEGLKQEIKLALRNQSALLFVSTKDMNTLPNRWETVGGISLQEGRWLDLTDYEEARPVCMINSSFALFRDLAVGDTLTVDMQDYYYGEVTGPPGYLRKQYVPYVRELERYDWQQPGQQHKLELEIVGTYFMSDSMNSRERNLVYIPDSVMPADFGGDTLTTTEQAMFSYVLNSYKDVNVFIQENRDALSNMGLKIAFLNNNAEGFWKIMEPLQGAKMIVIIACAVLLILTLMLSVYLYLHQRRKEFAIMRALGTPLKAVRSQLLLPMSMIGGAGIAIGGYAAWRYAMQQIEQVMAPLARWQVEVPKFEPPSMLLLLALCAAIFLLMQLILYIGTAKMSGQPVLEVLQAGNAAVQQKIIKDTANLGRMGEQLPKATTSPVAWDTSRGMTAEDGKGSDRATYTQKGYKSLRSYITSGWYVMNNIVRAPLKPALTVAVAIIFVLTLGWMNQLIERNEVEIGCLYSIANVEAEIMVDSVVATVASTIPKVTMDAIRDSGYVIGTNVQHARWWEIHTDSGTVDGIRLHAIDNPNALTGEWRNTSIEYAEGWDESLFAVEFPGRVWHMTSLEYAEGWDESLFAVEFPGSEAVPIAVSSDILSQLDLKLGDKTTFRSLGDDDNGTVVVYGIDTVVAAVFTKNSTATITSGAEQDNDNTVLLPYSMTELIPSYVAPESVAGLLESKNRFNTATFMINPARNRELASSTVELDELVKANTPGLVPMTLRLWDEELRQVVEPMEYTLSLLDVLYPIIVTASIMIAAGLAVLMILQSIKLVAVLRVLGTTRTRVIAMLSSEQVIVCLVGLALGIFADFIFLGAAIALSSSSFAQAGLYLAGALFGSLFAARMAIRKSPMDLLQVKE